MVRHLFIITLWWADTATLGNTKQNALDSHDTVTWIEIFLVFFSCNYLMSFFCLGQEWGTYVGGEVLFRHRGIRSSLIYNARFLRQWRILAWLPFFLDLLVLCRMVWKECTHRQNCPELAAGVDLTALTAVLITFTPLIPYLRYWYAFQRFVPYQ